MSDGSVKGFGSVYLREPEQLRTGYGLGRAGVRLLFRGLRAQGFAVGAQRFLEVVDRGYDVGFRFGRSIVVRGRHLETRLRDHVGVFADEQRIEVFVHIDVPFSTIAVELSRRGIVQLRHLSLQRERNAQGVPYLGLVRVLLVVVHGEARGAIFRIGVVALLVGEFGHAGVRVEQHAVAFHRVGERSDVRSRAGDVGRILRTFKIKKNVEVTDNGKIII